MVHLTRRQLLGGAGALAVSTVLAGCAGFTGVRSSTSKKTITFSTWASDGERLGYEKLARRFEALHPGVTVALQIVPYDNIYTDVSAQLQADMAPDVFRVDYATLGMYSSAGQVLDLSDTFSDADAAQFTPALWRAIENDGKPYGIPQETDVSALVYNKTMFREAGITAVPDRLDDAWSWEEFTAVMERLRQKLPHDVYPFADNWQVAGASRWLTWVFNQDGRLLDESLTGPAIDSHAAAVALDYTRDFFARRYVPPNSSVKSSSYADTAFLAGTAAMASAGNFLLSEFTSATFDWGATYLPVGKRASTDLGGNALVVTKDATNPELAKEFLRFMANEDSIATFCADAMELPTRTSLVGKKLGWGTRPDLMPIFAEQSTTLTEADAAQLSSPSMSKINTVLQDQLDAAFTGGQSDRTTLTSLSSGIEEAMAA
jgi:multiple sugar transport system substrate-binding protein